MPQIRPLVNGVLYKGFYLLTYLLTDTKTVTGIFTLGKTEQSTHTHRKDQRHLHTWYEF